MPVEREYRVMSEAYTRIFTRCGLKTLPVEADTGVIGGKFSHEFMVPAETGENEVVYCEGCGYAFETIVRLAIEAEGVEAAA